MLGIHFLSKKFGNKSKGPKVVGRASEATSKFMKEVELGGSTAVKDAGEG